MMLNRRPGPTTRVRVTEWHDPAVRDPAGRDSAGYDSAGYELAVTEHEDQITTEEPMEVRIAEPGSPARRFGVTMRTPGNDFELAAGIVFSEGLIAGMGDIESIAYCTDAHLRRDQEFNVVTVHLSRRARAAWTDQQMAATSACGVCGTDSIDEVWRLANAGADADGPGARDDGAALPAELLSALPDTLRAHQRIFDRTGGLHAAGIFDLDGSALIVREDIGRHNAVDKAVGHALMSGIDSTGAILCTSGRLGFEIVQKAVMSGIGAVVAVGAPSSLAVSLAQRAGLTVTGFTRPDRMVVYAGRIRESSTAADPTGDRV